MKDIHRKYYFLVAVILLASCNTSEYEYIIDGNLGGDYKTDSEGYIDYKFRSISEGDKLSSSRFDNIVFVDSIGDFRINVEDKGKLLDSIMLTINIYPYDEIIIFSTKKNWAKKGFGKKKKIYFDFKTINLKELDESKYCSVGTINAKRDFNNGKHIHIESTKVVQYNLDYMEKYERALNELGLEYKILPLRMGTKNIMIDDCYREEMKNLIKETYGNNWLAKLKSNL